MQGPLAHRLSMQLKLVHNPTMDFLNSTCNVVRTSNQYLASTAEYSEMTFSLEFKPVDWARAALKSPDEYVCKNVETLE